MLVVGWEVAVHLLMLQFDYVLVVLVAPVGELYLFSIYLEGVADVAVTLHD